MKNKSLVKIINEVISEFDFLGNEEYTKEEENVTLLKNEEFQKQFICDSLVKKEKIKTLQVVQSDFSGDWEKNGYLTIDYIVELAYTYDAQKEPAKFGLQLKGDRIGYSEDGRSSPGDNMTAPVDEAWFNQIDWDAIDVKMFMVGERDDDIEFLAFEHAPKRIQHLFLNDFLGDFIGEWAGRGMGTPADYDNATKVGYC
jgi:hypothetical protein